jgi:hypothetical protein
MNIPERGPEEIWPSFIDTQLCWTKQIFNADRKIPYRHPARTSSAKLNMFIRPLRISLGSSIDIADRFPMSQKVVETNRPFSYFSVELPFSFVYCRDRDCGNGNDGEFWEIAILGGSFGAGMWHNGRQ